MPDEPDDQQGDLFGGDDDSLVMGDRALAKLRTTRREIATSLPDRPGQHRNVQVGFASAYLPKDKPISDEWESRSGRVLLKMKAGEVWNPKTQCLENVGLPFGHRSRQIALYLQTWAVQHRTPVVEVGRSLRAFIKDLHKEPDGTGRAPQDSDFQHVWDQFLRFAATSVTLVTDIGKTPEQIDGRFVNRMKLWAPDGARDWQKQVTLSQEFYDALVAQNYPLDARAVSRLRNSAWQLDIYQWLAYRLCQIGYRPMPITWLSLWAQFGQETKTLRKFRQTFLKNLRVVQEVYPDAKKAVQVTERGLLLYDAPPPVPKQPLITD